MGSLKNIENRLTDLVKDLSRLKVRVDETEAPYLKAMDEMRQMLEIYPDREKVESISSRIDDFVLVIQETINAMSESLVEMEYFYATAALEAMDPED